MRNNKPKEEKTLYVFLKNHKVVGAFLIFAVFFILPLFLVHLSYHAPLPVLIVTDLTESDMLGFIAGFESLLGTIILSVLALSQTERLKKEEDFAQRADVKRPFFVIDRVEYKQSRLSGLKGIASQGSYLFDLFENGNASIYLKNVGEGVAAEIKSSVSFGEKMFLPFQTWINIQDDFNVLCLPSLFDRKAKNPQNQTIEIMYRNMVGIRYSQTILISIYKKPVPDDGNESILIPCWQFNVSITPQIVVPNKDD